MKSLYLSPLAYIRRSAISLSLPFGIHTAVCDLIFLLPFFFFFNLHQYGFLIIPPPPPFFLRHLYSYSLTRYGFCGIGFDIGWDRID
ncbi:hypothetical protein P167DRAFT_341597 [Morchella conica CCBAS932]|uniref:Uncharacterized protein n=1 Tax=Morchella conica CCBAS932 TaxID=1392247 RepID=A0A3N4KDD1_9PEZI|nr:hypothetical protein P167DRAFT_341597 [Morchella conica CCBAS932]